MPKARLDKLLVDRGLVATRERARALILAGNVKVGSQAARKAGDLVAADADISLIEPDHPFVGRGGVKLAGALDAFGIAVEGRDALDIGASTGGFTDVLLHRGAARVIALDVGRGQLDWRLRSDARVVTLEGVNARHVSLSMLPFPVDLVVIDVSFISLQKILPAVSTLLSGPADVVALVKPQFEAGRGEVGKGGIVRDHAVHERVVIEISRVAAELGLRQVAMAPSTLPGATGNLEFFLHLERR